MRQPRRFNLLIVRGDGRGVFRLNFPRWIAYSGVALLVLAVSTLGAIFGDYVFLKREHARMALLQQEVTEQQDLIDTFHRRIAEVRGEVASWRELHAKIWRPFGPEKGPPKSGTGIGGIDTLPPVSSEDGASLTHEVDLLAAGVEEEGEGLRALARFLAKTGPALAVLPSRWPVRGPVNSEFGRRPSPWAKNSEFHGGIDIDADRRTPVRAPAPGKVVFAGGHGDYGRAVVLDHGNDVRTLYGHLTKIKVRSGQQVKRGQVIALTGNTGRSSGPHLHYEVRVKGRAVNPRRFLWD